MTSTSTSTSTVNVLVLYIGGCKNVDMSILIDLWARTRTRVLIYWFKCYPGSYLAFPLPEVERVVGFLA